MIKKLLLGLALITLVACSTPASANDVADDGKCLDDIKHYNHLVKTTSASDEDKASAIVERDKGSEAWAQGEKEKCETAYQAAWALID
jgi:hypothetical protein